MTSSFQKNFHGSKLEVAAYGRSLLPSGRNKTTREGGSMNAGYLSLSFEKVKALKNILKINI
jgi:hypothetical protein